MKNTRIIVMPDAFSLMMRVPIEVPRSLRQSQCEFSVE
jgi:hypothetical protein